MIETTTPLQPLVSVIIPVYNCEKYLKETIESVIAQTEKNWEIIAVNDGSKDGSQEILKEYETLDPVRIRVISVENGGVSRARNTGANLAKGTFLAFLDHDDLWSPHKLEHQMNMFSVDSSLSLSFTNQTLIDEHGKTIKDSCYIFDHRHRGYVFELLVLGDFIPISSVMVKRDIFLNMGGFDPQFAIAEDWDFLLKVTRDFPVDYIDEPLVLYRLHKESGTFTNHERVQPEIDIVYNEWKNNGPSVTLKNLLPHLIFKVKVYYSDIKICLGISHVAIFHRQ